MLCQHRLDLPELDAKAADLDLVIDAAEKFDIAIGPISGQISRLVQARAWLVAEWIRDELFRCKLGPVQIAPRQTISPDIEFSRDADGNGFSCRSRM